jgi:hypothetical protein
MQNSYKITEKLGNLRYEGMIFPRRKCKKALSGGFSSAQKSLVCLF